MMLIIALSRRITARNVSATNTMKTVAMKMMKRGVKARYCDMMVSIPLVAVPNACADQLTDMSMVEPFRCLRK